MKRRLILSYARLLFTKFTNELCATSVAMLACFFCGATYVPLSESLPPARIAYILQDSKAVGVLTCSDPSISNALSQAIDVIY